MIDILTDYFDKKLTNNVTVWNYNQLESKDNQWVNQASKIPTNAHQPYFQQN
jgi:hypothetical protein